MTYYTLHIVKSPSSDMTSTVLLMRVFFFDDPVCFPLLRFPFVTATLELASSDSIALALVGLMEVRDLMIEVLVTESSGRS